MTFGKKTFDAQIQHASGEAIYSKCIVADRAVPEASFCRPVRVLASRVTMKGKLEFESGRRFRRKMVEIFRAQEGTALADKIGDVSGFARRSRFYSRWSECASVCRRSRALFSNRRTRRQSQRAGLARDSVRREFAPSCRFIQRKRLVPSRSWLIYDVRQKHDTAEDFASGRLCICSRVSRQVGVRPFVSVVSLR